MNNEIKQFAQQSTHGNNNRRPNSQMPNRPKSWWRRFPYVSMILSIISQLVIWWTYPLIYSKNLVGGRWQENPLLLTYSILCAFTIFWTFRRGFNDWKNFLFLVIPVGYIYFLYQQMSFQQVILLALLPLTLVFIQTKWLSLQNTIGLVLFSGIATLALPVTIFYQQNTYLTQPFLISLLPLLLSYLFYMSSIFVPEGRERRIIALAFGIALLLNVLSLPWNIWTLIAIVIIVFTWMILINLNLKAKYRIGVYSVLQMTTVLLIFVQQK